MLVYLNDVEEGGSTRFEKLGPIDVRPKKGRCLLFFPGTKASMPDQRTLHTAVEAGAFFLVPLNFCVHQSIKRLHIVGRIPLC